MKTFKNLRLYIGHHSLMRKTRTITRNRKIHNFSDAHKAGMIFTCNNDDDFQAVKEFKKYLEDKNIKTTALGFINDKKIPDHLLLRTGFSFFSLKNLDFYFKPESRFIHDFINDRFDLLFDLSLSYHFPVNYIVTLSPAEYKIGRLTDSGEYDLMIDIGQNNQIEFFINQIKHYLNMIKSKQS